MAEATEKRWIVSLLEKVAALDQPTTAGHGAKVVTMPRNLDKLHTEIRKVQGELVQAQARRGHLGLAWAAVQKEHGEMLAENEAAQGEIITRLEALQRQMADAVKECGIRAEIVSAKVSG